MDNGETEAINGKKFPTAAHPFVKAPDGFLYSNPANFPADFAADLPLKQAQFEAQAQMLTSASVFTANIPDPAWKVKPSWYMVAKSDKIINPDLERMYAKRAHSHTVEIAGASHSVYESHPKEVLISIESDRFAEHGGACIARCLKPYETITVAAGDHYMQGFLRCSGKV